MQAGGNTKKAVADPNKTANTKKRRKSTLTVAKKGPKKKEKTGAHTKQECKEAPQNVIKSYSGRLTCGDGDGGSSGEDCSDDEEEGEDSYRVGGYHPISIGDKFHNGRYIVVEKLGWGHFSTVWMCYDKKSSDESHHLVALKVQKSAPNYREAALDEIDLLKCISAAATTAVSKGEYSPNFNPHVVRLWDSFDHPGPNGKHLCMVFEMMGENLLKVIKRYNYHGLPVPIVKTFARQICQGLDFLHRHCHVIHTDLKPENILISAPVHGVSMDRVMGLIAEKAAPKTSKKKGKGGDAKTADSKADAKTDHDLADSLAKVTLDDEKGQPLTADQRKKLKKKLKKKRAMRKKSEATKKPANNRTSRKQRAQDFKRTAASLEKEQVKQEMMMMEKDSFPHDEALGPVGLDSSLQSEAKSSLERYENDQLPVQERPAYSSLLRPGVFGHINLDCRGETFEDFECIRSQSRPLPGRTNYDGLEALDPESYSPPDQVFYASLPLVVPLERMMSVLGAPHDQDGLGWYFRLTLSVETGARSYSAADRDDLDDISDTFVHVRQHNANMDYFSGMLSSALLSPQMFGTEEFGVVDGESIFVFEVIHHAAKTEYVLALLESQLQGMYFMCHYDFQSICMDEEDSDVFLVCRQLCRHPMCKGAAAAGDDRRAVKYSDERDDYSDDDEAEGGSGVLIGVDLLTILKSIVHIQSGDDLLADKQVVEIMERMRSLDERLRVFVGDSSTLHCMEREIRYMFMSTRPQYAQSDDDDDDDEDSLLQDHKQADLSHWDKLNATYRGSSVSIVDLGNACYTHKHFTDDIQTRQYRSPEVIVGAGYDCSADMWSMGCVIFELLTGDLMFDPHSGKTWSREEDHLALMMELLHCPALPKSLAHGKRVSEYYTRSGELKHIDRLNFWDTKDVLVEKYKFSAQDAQEVGEFLDLVMVMEPDKRATAAECLRHPWLQPVASHSKTPSPKTVGLSDGSFVDLQDD